MKTLYIVIDIESDTNIAVGYNLNNLLSKVREQDVYFDSDEDFDKHYQDSYDVEVWNVEEKHGII